MLLIQTGGDVTRYWEEPFSWDSEADLTSRSADWFSRLLPFSCYQCSPGYIRSMHPTSERANLVFIMPDKHYAVFLSDVITVHHTWKPELSASKLDPIHSLSSNAVLCCLGHSVSNRPWFTSEHNSSPELHIWNSYFLHGQWWVVCETTSFTKKREMPIVHFNRETLCACKTGSTENWILNMISNNRCISLEMEEHLKFFPCKTFFEALIQNEI